MNHHQDKPDPPVTCRRPRSGAYSRTVINLTPDEERHLTRIADRLGMTKEGARNPSKAMVIAEMIRRLGCTHT